MIKAGIIGATGYAGAEIVRLLMGHPEVEIKWYGSRSYIDQRYADIYRNMFQIVEDVCKDDNLDKLAEEVDVIFTATPQGFCASVINEEILSKVKVIDLSADFRIKDVKTYEKWYGIEHKSPEYIKENAELSPKKGLFAYAFAGRDITGKSIEDIVYEAQRKVILELAGKEPCVIVGRNADYILKDRDDVLNVFIHGDMPEKVQRIMGLYNVEEKEAVKMMADTDKRRMTNYNFYTEQKWGKASNYTLCLNSSQLGYDRCEKIIMDCM